MSVFYALREEERMRATRDDTGEGVMAARLAD
jgi:hypothetical protein